MFGVFCIIYTTGRWIKEKLEPSNKYTPRYISGMTDQQYIDRILKMNQKKIEKIIRKYDWI